MRALLTSLTLVALSLSAAELPIPEEQAALAAVAKGLFEKPPEWSATKGAKTLVWSKDQHLIRVTLDPKTEHVIGDFSNGIPVTNDRLTKLAACKELTSLAYDHSGTWHFKEIPESDFSGAGFEAFADSKVESVRIGGSNFGEAGALAIAKMKSLETLKLHHVPMTRPGMEAISKHGSLVSFSVSIMHQADWYDLLPLVAAMPKVEITSLPYNKVLHGNAYFPPRLKALMTAEEYARLEKLAEAKP